MSSTKNCLVISYGPVPTARYQTVEGGGMRVHGLAIGLAANGINTTIAINEAYPQHNDAIGDIKLVNWRLDGEFIALINSFDAVIVSYNMGDLSVFVTENINSNIQLILDAYVPIYIEVSARKAEDMDTEYVNYAADLQRHNFALRRGDYFLTANAAQDVLYTGVLSALGIINPYSYHDKRIIRTPFGIHSEEPLISNNPYKELGIKSDDFVVLWFGGIYPWFRIDEYLDAIKELVSKDRSFRFVFVGGKNPFNPNPDLARQYDAAVKFARDNHLLDSHMYFVDWVDYDTRANWYKYSNIIVSLNQPGQENMYSWRTRVMDFVWGNAVILTNGGDPLSEELIEKGGALPLDKLRTSSIVASLSLLKQEPERIADVRKSLEAIKESYYWCNVTKELAEVISKHDLPYNRETELRLSVPANSTQSYLSKNSTSGKIRKVLSLPAKTFRYAKRKGLLRTTKAISSTLRARIKAKRNLKLSREPQFVFISHPINNTGAPIVLLQIVEEYVEKYGSRRVRVIAPSIEKQQDKQLRNLGVVVEKAVHGVGLRAVRLQLGLQPDDFVFMNTIAVYDNYRDLVLRWLELGRLKHAHWFIHEDQAQIPVISPSFVSNTSIERIKRLHSSQKLSLYFPSHRTASEYEELLGIKNLRVVRLLIEVEDKYKKPRRASDFSTINFLISGTASDGRKGQLIALSAFQHFLDTSYKNNPDKYRDFTLHLVAIGKKDYISQQIRWIGESGLEDKLKIYDILPKSEAMEITSKCNAVMCLSLNETFGLYIAEAMLMGHVVVRNNTAGVDEQLVPGKNGYAINHKDIKDVAQAIERILNKDKSSNTALLAMGKKSQELMENYTQITYIEQIDALR